MVTVGAIALRGQFQAFVNGAFELRSGLRRERWCGVGLGWVRAGAKQSVMGSKIWDGYNQSKSRSILYEAGFGFGFG